MRLTSVPIKNYQSVNSFDVEERWDTRQGDANVLVFRIVDLDQEGLRYLTQTASPGYSMAVTFPTVHQNKSLVLTATPVAPLFDLSLWQVTVAATQQIYSGAVSFALTEGAAVRNWSVDNMIAVEPILAGGC